MNGRSLRSNVMSAGFGGSSGKGRFSDGRPLPPRVAAPPVPVRPRDDGQQRRPEQQRQGAGDEQDVPARTRERHRSQSGEVAENDTATTEIYTLSLHALSISVVAVS